MIVGDLEIRLRADIARLQQDLNGARREVGGAMQHITRAVNIAKVAFAALAGALVGRELAAMVSEVRQAAVDIERMAAMAGSTTDEFQRFAAGSATVGIEMDKFSDIVKDVQDRIGDFLVTGGGEMTDFFEKIAPRVGVTIEQFKNLSGPQALQLFTTTLERANVGQAVMIQQLESLASDASMLAPLLANGGAAFKRIGDDAEAAGFIMKKALIDASKIWAMEIQMIQMQMGGIGRTIATFIIPQLAEMSVEIRQNIAIAFQEVMGWVEGNKKELIGTWNAAKAVGLEVWDIAKGAAMVFGWLVKIGLEMGFFRTVFEAVGLMVAGLQDGIKVMAAALSALVGNTLSQVRTVIQAIGSFQKFIGRTEAAKYFTDTAAEIKVVEDAMKGYAAGVVDEFATSESAVQKYAEAMGKVKPVVLDLANSTSAALKAFGDGSGAMAKSSKEAADAAAKEASAYQSLIGPMKEKIAAGELELMGYSELTDAQNMTIKLDESIRAGKLDLSKAHIDHARALIEAVATQDLLIESQRHSIEQAEAKMAADGELIKSAQEEADRNVELVRTFGLTASAIEAMELARLREQLAQADSSKGYTAEIAKLEELIFQRERSVAALDQLDGFEAAKKANDDKLAGQVRMWDSIDQTARDTFVSIFDAGKSTFDRLRDSLKNGLLDLLYQMTMKKWIFNIGASVSGAGFAGAAQASGGGAIGSSIGMMQGISSAYSAITSGFASIGSSVSMGVQAGIDAVGGTAGMMGPTAAGGNIAAGGQTAAMAGTAATYAAGIAAGKLVGSAISGEYGIAGHGSAVVNVGTAIGAIWGPLGAAIGGAIGGLANRAFGMGNKNVTSTGITGTLGAGGFSGETYSNWTQKGGWFRSDKNGTDRGAVDAATADSFGNAYKALQSASTDFANALGINANAIATRTQALNIALTNDAAANTAAVTAFFVGVGNAMANELAPNIAAFAKAGEESSATLQRLSGSITVANAWLSLLRQRLFQVSLAGGDAASKLADAFGSLDNLVAASKGFYDLYYTEGERAVKSQEAMTDALAAVNLAMPDTMANFRALAGTLDLNTDAGRAAYAALLTVAPEFAAVAAVTAKMAEDAAKSLLIAFTGNGKLTPALDATTLKFDTLTTGMSSTGATAGSISKIFLEAKSGLLTFNTTGTAMTPIFSNAQLAALKLTGEIDDLKLSAGGTIIDIAGLSKVLLGVNALPVGTSIATANAYLSGVKALPVGTTIADVNAFLAGVKALPVGTSIAEVNAALAGVNTATFVATMGLVFDNLAARIAGVIGDIGTERIALREAALQIINPTVMSKAAIQRGITGIDTDLPSNSGLSSSAASLAVADRLVLTRASQQSSSLAALNAAKASAASTAAVDAQRIAARRTSLQSMYNSHADIRRLTGYNSSSLMNGSIAAGTWVNAKFGAYGGSQAQTDELAARLTNLSTANSMAATNAASGAVKVAAALAAYNKSISATGMAQTAANKAADVAKKAQLDYASALQNFSIDAGKSVSKLSKLREETVKYYDTQKQLADLMSSSAVGLRATVADYRYSQMTDAQQFSSLQASYATAYSMALSTDGEALAGYGSTLNSALNPLLEKAKEVLSDSSYATFAATAISRAEAIAKRLETLTPTDYAADSLLMLGQIDATLAALDASSKSAERIIADAIGAGSDRTADGLRAVIAALTGSSIPAFATGGDHAGGLRLVGENGPELEVTGPSRIFNAAQTRSMMTGGSAGNTARLEALVEQQNQELAAMRAELRAIASSNAKMERLADRVYVEGTLVRTDTDMPLQTLVTA